MRNLVRHLAVLLLLISMIVPSSWAADKVAPVEEPSEPAGDRLSELIDTPTAETVDQYNYLLRFRFYNNGGVYTKPTFGIYPRLNLGFALDTEHLIGSTTHGIRIDRPSINLKWRFYDGQDVFPAIAVGYDSLGMYYDHSAGEYAQREKGLFLVGTKEIFFPGLQFSGGINTYQFSTGNEIHGFMSTSYAIHESAAIFAEWDNIRNFDESRINLGIRFYVNPSFSIDGDLRNGRGTVPPSDSRRTDRNVQLNYLGSF